MAEVATSTKTSLHVESSRAAHAAALGKGSAVEIGRTAEELTRALRERAGAPDEREAEAEAVALDLLHQKKGLRPWLDGLGKEVDLTAVEALRAELGLCELLLDLGTATDADLLALLAAKLPLDEKKRAKVPAWVQIEVLLLLCRTLADASDLTDVFQARADGDLRLRAEHARALAKWIEATWLIDIKAQGKAKEQLARADAVEKGVGASLQDRAIQALGTVRTTDDATPDVMRSLLRLFLGRSNGITPEETKRQLTATRRASAGAAFVARIEREVRAAWHEAPAPPKKGSPSPPPENDDARRARAIAAFGRALDPSTTVATTQALRDQVNAFLDKAAPGCSKDLTGERGRVWVLLEAAFSPWTFFPPGETQFDGNDYRTLTRKDAKGNETTRLFSLPTSDAWYHSLQARKPESWVLWDLGERAPDVLARHLVHVAVARGSADLLLNEDHRLTHDRPLPSEVEQVYRELHDPVVKGGSLTGGGEHWCKEDPERRRWLRQVEAHLPEYSARFRANLLQHATELARHPDPELRCAALRLMTWTRQARMLPHLVRGLADPDSRVQEVAQEYRDASRRGVVASWIREPRALEAANDHLRGDSAHVRDDPLARLDARSKALVVAVRSELAALVTDPWAARGGVQFELQTEALWRVRRIGVPAGVDEWPLLLFGLRHPDPELHEWCLRGLVRPAHGPSQRDAFDRAPYPGEEHAARHAELAGVPGFAGQVVRSLQLRLEELWRDRALRHPPAGAAGKPPEDFTARVDASIGPDLALLAHLGAGGVRAWLAAVVTGHGLPEGVSPPEADRVWCVRFHADQSLPTKCVEDLLGRTAPGAPTHLERMPQKVREAALARLKEEAKDPAGLVEALRGLRALEVARDAAAAPLRGWLEDVVERYADLSDLDDAEVKGLLTCSDPASRKGLEYDPEAHGSWFLNVADGELDGKVLGRLDAKGRAALLDVLLDRNGTAAILGHSVEKRCEVISDWLRRASEPDALGGDSWSPPFAARWPRTREACADLLAAFGEGLEVTPAARSSEQKGLADGLRSLATHLASKVAARDAAVLRRAVCALMNEVATTDGREDHARRRRRAGAWLLARVGLDRRQLGPCVDRVIDVLQAYHAEAGSVPDDLVELLRYHHGLTYEGTSISGFDERAGLVAVMTLSGKEELRREAVALRAAHVRALHADLKATLSVQEEILSDAHLVHHTLLQGIRLGKLRLSAGSADDLAKASKVYAAKCESYLVKGAGRIDRLAAVLDDYYVQRTLADLVDIEADFPDAMDDLHDLLGLVGSYLVTRPALIAAEQQLGAAFGPRRPTRGWDQLRLAADADAGKLRAATKAKQVHVSRYPFFALAVHGVAPAAIVAGARATSPSLPRVVERSRLTRLVSRTTSIVQMATDEKELGPYTLRLVEGLTKALKSIGGRARYKARLDATKKTLEKYSADLNKSWASPALFKKVNTSVAGVALLASSIDVVESWEDGLTFAEALSAEKLGVDSVKFSADLCEWLSKNEAVVERFHNSYAGKLAKRAAEKAGQRGVRAAALRGGKALGKKVLRAIPVVGHVLGCGIALLEAQQAFEAGDTAEGARRTMESVGYGLLVAAAVVEAFSGGVATPLAIVLVVIGASLVIFSYLWDLWDLCFGDNEYEKLARRQGYALAD